MNSLDGINIVFNRMIGNCDIDCNFGYYVELCEIWLIECWFKNINILGIDLILLCIFVMKKCVMCYYRKCDVIVFGIFIIMIIEKYG